MKYHFYGGPNDGRDIEPASLARAGGGETHMPPSRVCVPAWTGNHWLQVYYERSGDVYLYIGEVSQRPPRGD
jgi:hypothetical protein